MLHGPSSWFRTPSHEASRNTCLMVVFIVVVGGDGGDNNGKKEARNRVSIHLTGGLVVRA